MFLVSAVALRRSVVGPCVGLFMLTSVVRRADSAFPRVERRGLDR